MISAPIVAAARLIMGAGSSMTEAAVQLNVRSSDLDLALWRNIGTPIAELLPSRERRVTRYKPDFE